MTAALEVMPSTGTVAILTALCLSPATFYRARKPKTPSSRRSSPARALSHDEQQTALAVLHEERFADRPPAEIVSTLAAEGRYLASERTMYRLLAASTESKERRRQLVHPAYVKPELIATAPNQVWSWDITKLMTFEKFVYLHLYVVMDIFSRYVVGWMLAAKESASLATRLLEETISKHNVTPGEITLHADRGAPMRSKLLAELLAKLDVVRSFSRPHTSNDNPFSESAFKTLKYHPSFPKKFHGDVDGRAFCQPYFNWYNNKHHHSGIALMTPADVHFGRAEKALEQRHHVKLAAYAAHPQRFVHGPPRLERLPAAVYINPPTTLKMATGVEPACGLAHPAPPSTSPSTTLSATIDIPFSSTATFMNTGGFAH